MPYDKETRDALQAYYETHDFTGSIPAFDDKKYTPAQLQIYAKAKKFFAQSWLKLLPEMGNKRSMRNFSKNYPLNCLKEGPVFLVVSPILILGSLTTKNTPVAILLGLPSPGVFSILKFPISFLLRKVTLPPPSN